LECNEGGFSWEELNMFGDLFPTLHVAAVIMHAALVIIMFYRFPKKIFYPDSKGYLLNLKCQESPTSDTEQSVFFMTPKKKV
jgi:hypothetical protein